MSSSLTNIAASGLQAAQVALNTVGNNISNSAVTGYNRETTQLAEMLSGGVSGNGVSVTGVSRVYDSLIVTQLRSASTSAAASSAYYGQISQIDDMLASSDTDISSMMSKFFSSIQSLSSNASDSAARQTVIDSANSMVNQFKSADSYLQDMDNAVNQSLSSSADEINNYAQQIANLNSQIVRSGGGDASNAMLDQRDELVSELNGIVGVTATVQDNNSVNLTFANGLTLVQGSSAYKVQSVPSSADPSQTTLAYDRGTGTPVEIDPKTLTTGSVGGLLSFRSGALADARNALGQLALGMAGSFNAQHEQGVDLNGDAGEKFFDYSEPTVTPNSKNSTGGASLTATYSDTSQVKASDYSLKYAGGAWQVTRLSDGATVTATAGTDDDGNPTLNFDGLSVSVSGTPTENDKYTLNTVSNVINSLSVAITDPSKIAAGLDDADSGESDNRNAEALLALQTAKVVGGTAQVVNGVSQVTGGSTLSTAYATLVSKIGTETSNADVTSTAQANIVTQLTTQQQSASGVNLDEEYIDLSRYQEYYQANAQVLSTASTLFNSLLTAVAG
ncbi:flagellar hook-associated protein FlgK [Sodalis ligni]|jgi:flagellar hook-associated protein 1 FlgK|uniref:Flagellar hook-associated protein 1 n=1 Tax=Sodalis ligni TaxID=2697027 RepID=A0A4R1N5D5_9GAMM|nr:flagellar hook-associated protein FlgK [Sodalis ligni]TCL02262.1 flagellar hook-associated protein 1 FlgK [Sodalis ligni]